MTRSVHIYALYSLVLNKIKYILSYYWSYYLWFYLNAFYVRHLLPHVPRGGHPGFGAGFGGLSLFWLDLISAICLYLTFYVHSQRATVLPGTLHRPQIHGFVNNAALRLVYGTVEVPNCL